MKQRTGALGERRQGIKERKKRRTHKNKVKGPHADTP